MAIPDSISLRSSKPEDTGLLLKIFSSAQVGHPSFADRHSDSVRKLIEAEFYRREEGYRRDFEGFESLVIEVEGQAAGRVYRDASGDILFIIDLILLPEYRELGHGTAVLQQMLAEAEQEGQKVRLHVEKINTEAHRLYARLGFRQIDETAGTHWLLERAPEKCRKSHIS